MTKLSVNINKLATLRNSRGGNLPNLIKMTHDIQKYGAQGITIHPRPDERHIKYQDAYELKEHIYTEYNIEGNPITKFMDMVTNIKPTQVTLVPDKIDAITSNSGWDTKKYLNFLRDIISHLKKENIRSSIFVDPNLESIKYAAQTGTDRIELYTEQFAKTYSSKPTESIKTYIEASKLATELGLGINAGHDLNLDNIHFFKKNIPNLLEVSIGHALICESLYLGIENVVNLYINSLKNQ